MRPVDIVDDVRDLAAPQAPHEFQSAHVIGQLGVVDDDHAGKTCLAYSGKKCASMARQR